MAIQNTDKFLHVGNPGTATTLASPGYTVGNTSITVASTTNFPADTAVIFSIDTASTTTGQQVRNTGSYCVFVGIVTGAQTIGSLQLLSGTPQNYAASALTRVYITVSAVHTNRLIDGIRLFANDDGSLKSAAVKTALGVTSTTGGGWDILNAGTAPTVTTGYNSGNKEYKLTFAGVDLTSTLSAGMRLKFDRGTTAPTQSMSFTASSSQYATKASPTGITFTSAFTCEAWVYLNSYPGANGFGVISRDAATSSGAGFELNINSSGQLVMFYRNATGASAANSYQSIPLKRWVHIAMSVTASNPAGCAMYLNGSLIPVTVTATGATTIVQATALSIGDRTGSVHGYFDGYLSEVRLWSSAQTATQIQDNMAISLTGSETNLVALFQGNGNFTDKTANANTLTATGGAIATQAANPYNTTEYAIVTKVAFVTSNTTVTVFTGTDYNIPLMILINPFSSYQKAPFGFPAGRDKWLVNASHTSLSLSSTNDVWSNGNSYCMVPTGAWLASYDASHYSDNGATVTITHLVTLSTSTTAETDTRFTDTQQIGNGSGTTFFRSQAHRSRYITTTTPTPYYVLGRGNSSAGSLGNHSFIPDMVFECAYI